MEYNKIPQKLKRYSFREKMRILQIYSSKNMNPAGLVDISVLRNNVLPWELETFLLFSVASSDEWKNDSFDGKNIKQFFNITEAIRNYPSKVLKDYKDTLSFTDNFMISASAVQFDLQEYYPYKLYRYNTYFSFANDKIDMPKLFREKFGCEYFEFLVLVQFLWLCFSQNQVVIEPELLNFIFNKYPTVISVLSIKREDYIGLLNEITTNISDYLYCLRPSYTYPFINEGETLYLPLPHLLIRSVTSSLMYRLTECDNELSALIGKEVLEPYLYDIILESEIFDEVYTEQEYFDKKIEQRTLDVMARKGNEFIFSIVKCFRQKEIYVF